MKRNPKRRSLGFTMVELLIVMAIIAMLAIAAIPAYNALATANAINRASVDIAGMLEQARAYAMANNTYVYVGLQEVDGVTPSAANGTGRLVMVVVDSTNGMRPYTTLSGTPAISTNVAPLFKPQQFNGVHLTSSASLNNGMTMSKRPTVSQDLSTVTSTASFQWPLAGAPQNSFTKVLEFDPQGVPRVQQGSTFNSAVTSCIEIPLITAHGNIAPTTSAQTANQAAVQIDGMTGTVRIFQP
ncbi:MAG TPA: prepilin-type N-terminal cleavage/methylation domain-containing protein [Candidatus Methylacidiphilales bacterium]